VRVKSIIGGLVPFGQHGRGDGMPVESADVQVIERSGVTDPRSTKCRDRRVIHRQDPTTGVKQDNRIRKRFERRLQRVFRAHHLTDVRPAEFGQVGGHLIERGRQFPKFVVRRQLDLVFEAAFPNRVGAAGESPQRSDDAAGQVPGDQRGHTQRDQRDEQHRAPRPAGLVLGSGDRSSRQFEMSSRMTVVSATARRSNGLARS
jgi:hypothetical protein